MEVNAQQTLEATLGSEANPLTRASRSGRMQLSLIAASLFNSQTLPIVQAAVSYMNNGFAQVCFNFV